MSHISDSTGNTIEVEVFLQLEPIFQYLPTTFWQESNETDLLFWIGMSNNYWNGFIDGFMRLNVAMKVLNKAAILLKLNHGVRKASKVAKGTFGC